MKTLEDVLEEITPAPDPDFVAEMESRMRRGFPDTSAKRRLPRLALPSLRPRAAAAVAASAMLALLVTVTLLDDDGERAPDRIAAERGGDAEIMSADGSGGASSTVVPSPPAPVPPPDDGVAPRAATRHVERSAQLTLADDPREFDRLAEAIFRTADRRGGFVLRSSFTQGESGASSGFFELRVPSAELPQTLNELSRLATVRARSESGADVTGPIVSLRERLRNARAQRRSLLRRLERADSDRAAEALRQQLDLVTREITGMRAGLRGIRERADLATISVELVDEDTGGAAAGETGEAVDDAVGSLEDVLNFLIRALGVLVPVGVVAVLVWLGASYARRRARERALA